MIIFYLILLEILTQSFRYISGWCKGIEDSIVFHNSYDNYIITLAPFISKIMVATINLWHVEDWIRNGIPMISDILLLFIGINIITLQLPISLFLLLIGLHLILSYISFWLGFKTTWTGK